MSRLVVYVFDKEKKMYVEAFGQDYKDFTSNSFPLPNGQLTMLMLD
jgi:hypothetical protein